MCDRSVVSFIKQNAVVPTVIYDLKIFLTKLNTTTFNEFVLDILLRWSFRAFVTCINPKSQQVCEHGDLSQTCRQRSGWGNHQPYQLELVGDFSMPTEHKHPSLLWFTMDETEMVVFEYPVTELNQHRPRLSMLYGITPSWGAPPPEGAGLGPRSPTTIMGGSRTPPPKAVGNVQPYQPTLTELSLLYILPPLRFKLKKVT